MKSEVRNQKSEVRLLRRFLALALLCPLTSDLCHLAVAQQLIGDLVVQKSEAFTGDITPTQLAADADNYNPTSLATASALRLSTDASRTITGLAGGADGRRLRLINVGSFNVVLANESASSTAANRFALASALTLEPKQGIELQYDSTSSRWRPIGSPAQTAGTGTVTSFSAGDLSPLFTTSEATATTTPALTFALSTAAQNAVLAGPTSGTGAPAYRALVPADVPDLSATYQPLDAGLSSLAALNPGANQLPYYTALDTAAVTSLTAFARTLLDDTTAGDARTTLGLGTMAVASDASYLLKSSNLGDLPDATTARSNLGLANVTNDAQTTAAIVPNTVPAAGQLLVGNAGGTAYAPVTASGDITITSAGVTAIGANAVALGTDTTGNYVATIADSGASEITVANSGTETAAVTLAIASTIARDSEVTAAADAKVADAINDGTTTVAPSQNAVFDALALKAPLASPTFTGTPAAPTAAADTSTTQLATTAFAKAEADAAQAASQPLDAALTALAAGSDFVQFTGPTTSTKVFTLPNATATILTDNAAVTVAQGGTGRATSTTAYGLIAAGTTATGAHQTLAAGATTEILVGGGASALPVWTTATGSGAPVRATSPTLVTPVLGVASGTSVTLSSLTSGRLTFATTSGLLTDDADFTISGGDTLNATKIVGSTSITGGTGSFTTLGASGVVNFGMTGGTYGINLRGAASTGAAIMMQDSSDSNREWRMGLESGSWKLIKSGVAEVIVASSAGIAVTGGILVGAATGGTIANSVNVAGDVYKNNTAYTNPDYVLEHWATGRIERFKDKPAAADYRGLMPLADVEAFSRANLHLPRFGQQAGHGLFSGSDALLATVEEAYIHLFQHDARLTAVEARSTADWPARIIAVAALFVAMAAYFRRR